jgi:hypothetical protein
MRFYRIKCHAGPATTVYTVFQTWANDIDEAWKNARMAGLVPLCIET